MKTTWSNEYAPGQDLERDVFQDHGMIILPSRILERIDRNRDRYSRAEFVEFCIDTLLEQGGMQCEEVPPPALHKEARKEEKEEVECVPANDAVTRRDFEEFKKGIKDLIRAYINLLPSSIMEPKGENVPDRPERTRQQIAELLVR